MRALVTAAEEINVIRVMYFDSRTKEINFKCALQVYGAKKGNKQVHEKWENQVHRHRLAKFQYSHPE